MIYGTVHSSRSPPGVSIRATLLEPGPWAGTALCRKNPCRTSPAARVGPEGRYGMTVPSGHFRVEPFGDSLVASSPESAEASLADGEAARVDFSVEETDADPGRRADLEVAVRNPERRLVDGAEVELWPEDGDAERATPLRTAKTGPWRRPARFDRLSPAGYLLRATLPGYAPGVARAPALDPEADAPAFVSVDLRRGSTVEARIRDAEGGPASGVALDLRRIETPSSSDPVERLARGDAEVPVPPSSDQTGRLLVTGLTAGKYRAIPSIPGADGARRTLSIAVEGGTPGREALVTLGDEDRVALDVRILPAAAFVGRLVCADGGTIPRKVAACVSRSEACDDPERPMTKVLLSGTGVDRFEIGPVEPGSHVLALRPEGHDLWTFALGTPDAPRAARLHVEGTDPVDLGTIEVLCGPAVEIRPEVEDGSELPDLRDARVEASLTRTREDGTLDSRHISAERYPGRIVFRELPEGEWTFEATIGHRHFVPASPVTVSVPVALERGRVVSARAVVSSVGGAIVLRGSYPAARITGASGEIRIAVAAEERIVFEGVPQGEYSLEACTDASCGVGTPYAEKIRIRRLVTVEVGKVESTPER